MTIFRKTNTYNLFRQIVPDYINETILDFGGNRGNLISTSNGKILPENYTSMDISRRSLELCEKENPGVNTIHWNRYHSTYNKTGNISEPFPLLETYDIVFANSVFTHHAVDEMIYCIHNIMKYTDRLYFTFISPDNQRFFDNFLSKYVGQINLSDDQWNIVKDNDLAYIIDGNNVSDNVSDEYASLWTVIDKRKIISEVGTHSFKYSCGKTDWFDWMLVENK